MTGDVNFGFVRMVDRWAAPLLLAVLVAGLYLPTAGFDYVNIDDCYYTYNNPLVSGGMSAAGIRGACAEPHLNYWIPLTWLSLMADAEVFGLDPQGFHLTNALLHIVNSLLLLLFLRRATGSIWMSFLAAALWAVHPLRAESVAWITSRKDLLSGFFFLAALLAYLEGARRNSGPWRLTATALTALSLMAKPLLVVAPALFLAVDFWPLGRIGKGWPSLGDRLVEKTPLFLLSAVFAIATITTQRTALLDASPAARVANAVGSTVVYLKKTFWPVTLFLDDQASAFRVTIPTATALAVLLLAFTLCLFQFRNRSPEFLSGWIWYLAALLPVSGVVPLGMNLTADRFTYLPAIGLSFAGVWGLRGLTPKKTGRDRAVLAALIVLLAICAGTAQRRIGEWRNSFSLFSANVRNSGGSAYSHSLLGWILTQYGQHERAWRHLTLALEKNPDDYETLMSIGELAYLMGREREAIQYYSRFLERKTAARDDAILANVRIASAAIRDGDRALAGRSAESVLHVDPGNWAGREIFAVASGAAGDFAAIGGYLKRQPPALSGGQDPERDLIVIAALAGLPDEADAALKSALKRKPGNPDYTVEVIVSLLEGEGDETARHLFALVAGVEFRNDSTMLDTAFMREALLWKAAAAVRSALARRPSDAELNLYLAVLSEGRGDLVTAGRLYEKALVRNPELYPARRRYALLLAKLGRSTEASAIMQAGNGDTRY